MPEGALEAARWGAAAWGRALGGRAVGRGKAGGGDTGRTELTSMGTKTKGALEGCGAWAEVGPDASQKPNTCIATEMATKMGH